MNQGKLGLAKQEMARVNINILVINKLKWMGMCDFNSDEHYIYYWGQASLRRNEVTLIINKRVPNAIFRCDLKNERVILACFQGKPFNVTVIKIYASTTDAEDAEADWVYEDLNTFQN